MWHLDALSKLDGLDLAGDELSQFVEGLRIFREEDGIVLGVPLDVDRPVANAIINPMGPNLEPGGELVGPQVTDDDVRVGQFLAVYESVLTADPADGRWQDGAVASRAVSFGSQVLRDFFVGSTLFRESQDCDFDLAMVAELVETADGDRNGPFGDVAALPHDAEGHHVVVAFQNNFLHQAAQQRLLLRPR